MMQPIPGGAAAQPFITHHNALGSGHVPADCAGAVFEAPGRRRPRGACTKSTATSAMRGLSTRHNPEFTMLELYLAYGDYRDLMDWIEKGAARAWRMPFHGSKQIVYQGRDYDLSQSFRRPDG